MPSQIKHMAFWGPLETKKNLPTSNINGWKKRRPKTKGETFLGLKNKDWTSLKSNSVLI